jgi:hypothetical protein
MPESLGAIACAAKPGAAGRDRDFRSRKNRWLN